MKTASLCVLHIILLHLRSNRSQPTFTSAFIVVPRLHSIINVYRDIRCSSCQNTRRALHQSNTIDTSHSDPTEHENASLSTHVQVSFSHIHLFVDKLEDISVYKELETKLNLLSQQMNGKIDIQLGRTLWRQLDSNIPHPKSKTDSTVSQDSFDFISQNRDVVKQLLAGLGFRITAIRYPSTHDDVNTRSVLITSKDPRGVQIIVTAPDSNKSGEDGTLHSAHFHENELKRFFQYNANRQGIATLAFEVTDGDISSLFTKYLSQHPHLISEEYRNNLLSYTVDGSLDCTKVLEVYAYYKNEKADLQVDRATKLRFIQRQSSIQGDDKSIHRCPLPGLVPIEATFDSTCMPAYFDHWVSNVISRTSFIETMKDVLGFAPKVDFNAGVVAAGEAQIESTVIGNDSGFRTFIKELALQDQSQVYLPINNALSDVGHVNGFLQEIGQGIQHIASRVDNLAAFVQRGNDFREMTGEGFTFLKIPRSYYGVLSKTMIVDGLKIDGNTLSVECATSIMEACVISGIATPDGAVDIDMTQEAIAQRLDSSLSSHVRTEYQNQKERIIKIIMRSRYINLHKLLGDSFNDEKYLSLVRNQILVDIQGDDLLLQIFTSNILQRKAGEEAPFFEYIERVCSESLNSDGSNRRLRPGCGGFGIRNFLTLFLSIEVSKAMLEVVRARSAGDMQKKNYAERMVDIFTDQLNESNPILNEISDAMKEEGLVLLELNAAIVTEDNDAVLLLKKKFESAGLAKKAGNEKLMACSTKYKNMMRSLRLSNSVNI